MPLHTMRTAAAIHPAVTCHRPRRPLALALCCTWRMKPLSRRTTSPATVSASLRFDAVVGRSNRCGSHGTSTASTCKAAAGGGPRGA